MSIFGRRKRPAVELTDTLEQRVAVGALVGVEPGEIIGHVLIVMTRDGAVSIAAAGGCPEATTMLAARGSAELAKVAYARHKCGMPDA